MANFTIELRNVLKLTDDIGLNDYPIFDENYREILNKKIIDRFYFREIGQETIDMFRHYMQRNMNEIMVEYNQLYESERLKIDPLKTMNVKSISTQTGSGTTENTGSSSSESIADSKARAAASAMPQNRLQGDMDYAESVNDSTGKTVNNGEAAEQSKSESESMATATNESSGYSGNQSDMLRRYRATFLNIDLDILNRLEGLGLFMQIYMTNESFLEQERPYGYYPYPGFPIHYRL